MSESTRYEMSGLGARCWHKKGYKKLTNLWLVGLLFVLDDFCLCPAQSLKNSAFCNLSRKSLIRHSFISYIQVLKSNLLICYLI